MNSKPTILVADDDPRLVRVLRTNLERDGFTVMTAEDGKQVLNQVQRYRPDLIILDVMMPNLDGPETSQQLRSDPQTQDIPILFLTAILRKPEAQRRNRQGGLTRYVAKPYEIDDILTEVRSLLSLEAPTVSLKDIQNARTPHA
jgi:CheY-like chemotaxis protein